MPRDLFLAIDVGTGGLRSALVDSNGKVLALSHSEHEQIVPRFGWSEQRPADWWAGTRKVIRDILGQVENASSRIAAICGCGQMHGTVLIDDDGNPTLDAVPLWNDKRTAGHVDAYISRFGTARGMELTANMPTPAWPAFKLAWIAENRPDALRRASGLLMPKDWINFKLTGERAQDTTEASLSYLMDWKSRAWSDEMMETVGVARNILPPLRQSAEILGTLSADVALELGLSAGIPVLVGAGDYPMALLGSGVIRPGMGSDVTGTSTIITILHDKAVMDPEFCNVLTPNGLWGAMTLIEAGGDAVRWARRAFHENRRSYADVAEIALRAAPGSGGIFFLPYLSGERVAEKRNSRAQFFGLKAETGIGELHRAVLEGVAFSVRRLLDRLPEDKARPEQIVAASGGAKSELWLRIKASMYRVPYVVPEELECGVVGAAALMATSTGEAQDIETAVARMVRFKTEIQPDPCWSDLYDRMMPIYARLYEQSKQLYDDLESF